MRIHYPNLILLSIGFHWNCCSIFFLGILPNFLSLGFQSLVLKYILIISPHAFLFLIFLISIEIVLFLIFVRFQTNSFLITKGYKLVQIWKVFWILFLLFRFFQYFLILLCMNKLFNQIYFLWYSIIFPKLILNNAKLQLLSSNNEMN